MSSVVVVAVASLPARALSAPCTSVVEVVSLLACPLTDMTILGGPILPPALPGLWLLPRALLLCFDMPLPSTGTPPLVIVADSATVVVVVTGAGAIDAAFVA